MKSKNEQSLSSYERAQKKVKDIKGFYGHLAAYIIINLVLLVSRNDFRIMRGDKSSLQDIDFLSWIDWNIYGTPIIWGVFLIFHAINVFAKNPFLGKKWEERQIQKYLDGDHNVSGKYQ